MRRLEMDLEPGTRFRLFGHAISERMFEVAGFTERGRVLIRHADGNGRPGVKGEARRSVERWVLRELDRGGWPWPPYGPVV